MSDLEVVWASRDEKSIDAQLKQLEPNLFLDKERDRRSGGLVWVVRHWLGSGAMPPLVLEWRDGLGNALPLSSGIVYEVEKRKANFGKDLLAETMAANDALQEKREAEAAEEYEEIAREIAKHRALGNFSVVPRSQALRISRARARERKAEQQRLNEQARELERDLARRQR